MTDKVMNAPYVVASVKAVVYLSGRLIYLETNTDFCLCFHAFVKSFLAVALGDSCSVSESLLALSTSSARLCKHCCF